MGNRAQNHSFTASEESSIDGVHANPSLIDAIVNDVIHTEAEELNLSPHLVHKSVNETDGAIGNSLHPSQMIATSTPNNSNLTTSFGNVTNQETSGPSGSVASYGEDFRFLFGTDHCRSFQNASTQTKRVLRRSRKPPVRFGYARHSHEKVQLALLRQKLQWNKKKTRRFSSMRHPGLGLN